MPVALIAIGLPGSGKTTLLKPLAERYGLVRVNKDEIREAILGSMHEQSRNKEVWEESNRRIRAALGEGAGVILDNTNLERWKRKDAISLLQEAGATRILGLLFNVPAELASARNRSRSPAVKDEVMTWMEQKLTEEPPEIYEGFDALYTLEDIGKLEKELEDL